MKLTRGDKSFASSRQLFKPNLSRWKTKVRNLWRWKCWQNG